MRENYSDITFILDRSGSMHYVRDDTIGGFNSFIKEQQSQPGECTFTLVQFDTEYEFVYKNVKIADAQPLTIKTFVPRGGTALLDAIGRAINETGKRFSDMSEDQRPSKVIFVIQTDGEENSSKEFKLAQINEMISRQRNEYSWEFIFLGANQDAIATASSMNIDVGKSLTYANNTAGSAAAYKTISKITSNIRSGVGPQDVEQSDIDVQTAAGVKASPAPAATP